MRYLPVIGCLMARAESPCLFRDCGLIMVNETLFELAVAVAGTAVIVPF